MKKEFKHKQGYIATSYKGHTYNVQPGDYTIPAIIIEDSEDWQEVTKDYEILKYIGDQSGRIFNSDTEIITKEKFSIYSVKRLSDGEVFSVGDKDSEGREIMRIVEVGTLIKIYVYGNWYWLKDAIKFRKPILTTEDGVELFEGDGCTGYDPDDLSIFKTEITKTDPLSNLIYFSTREAAEEYRLWNYRGLSLRDINDKTGFVEGSINVLKEFVKSRLK